MLRKARPFRRLAMLRGEAALSATPGAPVAVAAAEGPLAEAAAGNPPGPTTAHIRRHPKLRWVLISALAVMVAGGALAYQQKSRFSAEGADLSRRLIGDERTARLESWYFTLQDRVDRTKYRLVGGETNPFADEVAEVQFVPRAERTTYLVNGAAAASEAPVELGIPYVPPPAPIILPVTHQLRDNPAEGEGVWTTAGLPRSSPGDILMAKTFLRPDKSRPYAVVGVLLMDARRVRLHMVGGTVDPGGDRGVKGSGIIPASDYPALLAAWNGGFKGPHGNYGMVAAGQQFRPLRNGLATIAVMKDGKIKMGEWGSTIGPDDNLVAARQNAVLLVKDGEVSKRVNEGNDTWGYVNVDSSEFITWRSAVGLTKDGNLLFAAGNSLSAASLAQALWAAGAQTAMQLDINNPYVLSGLLFPQADGTVKATKFLDSMPDNPHRFLKTQERDFMYVTLDESRYR